MSYYFNCIAFYLNVILLLLGLEGKRDSRNYGSSHFVSVLHFGW